MSSEEIIYGPFPSDHPVSAIGRFEAEMHAQGGIVLFVGSVGHADRDTICTWLEATLGSNRDFDPQGWWCASCIVGAPDGLMLDAIGLFRPLDEVVFRLRFSEKMVTQQKAWRIAHLDATLDNFLGFIKTNSSLIAFGPQPTALPIAWLESSDARDPSMTL